jgi:hypothetical protein
MKDVKVIQGEAEARSSLHSQLSGSRAAGLFCLAQEVRGPKTLGEIMGMDGGAWGQK